MLLTTDGIHDTVNHTELEPLEHTHQDRRQTVVDALTAATRDSY
ncbi:hypothetical protein AADR41_02015 [Streptomyces sp. CLV115]